MSTAFKDKSKCNIARKHGYEGNDDVTCSYCPPFLRNIGDDVTNIGDDVRWVLFIIVWNIDLFSFNVISKWFIKKNMNRTQKLNLLMVYNTTTTDLYKTYSFLKDCYQYFNIYFNPMGRLVWLPVFVKAFLDPQKASNRNSLNIIIRLCAKL